jgi:hypothetical protein
MIGDSQDMATEYQGMIMPHCETFAMSRETFSRSMETITMSREKWQCLGSILLTGLESMLP